VSAGSISVLFLSGVVMCFTRLTPLAWRTGATLGHNWFALAVGMLVLGHIYMALHCPLARTGRVPLRWARKQHAAWAREESDD